MQLDVSAKTGINLEECCVVLASFNPGNSLVDTVAQLRARGFNKIAVVDDGSAQMHLEIFEQSKQMGAVVIQHMQNLGKGQAIKSGLRWALNQNCRFFITMDSDGQHLVSDVLCIAIKVLSQRNPLVALGVRQFTSSVPLRSRLGNKLTQWIFKKLSGMSVGDTQTGLRAFPMDMASHLINVPGDRYEYEMNVLISLANLNYPIIEVPIKTVYIDENSSSHFRPVIDSIRIYFVLFRDIFLALSSFAIDIGFFTVFMVLTGDILLSTFLARAISGSYNFLGNKFFVFKINSAKNLQKEIVGYLLLAFAIASTSGFLVGYFDGIFPENLTFIKICVDLGLYLASFSIRRLFIFPRTQRKSGDA